MTMPVNLVLVRHGESEINVAIHHAERGDTSFNDNVDFIITHDSRYRLTDKGQAQAKAAGEWLRQNDLGYFDRRYTSQYARAMETAALLGINGPDWYIDAMLREREWGDISDIAWDKREGHPSLTSPHREREPFYWCPQGGESIAALVLRLRSVLDTLHRECSEMNVIIVAHGEVMWALRYMLERMTVDAWSTELENQHIDNCQIIHYSRRNPFSGAISPHLDWQRSISPTNHSNSHDWREVKRLTFSDHDLMLMASRAPRFFADYD